MNTKSHDEYPGYSHARVFVCAFVQLHVSLVSTTGVRIVVNICCLRISVWTVKAMFCILLTFSHLAVKVAVQKQRQRAEWKTDRGKEEGGNFLPLQMEDLSEPAESRHAFHITIEER